MENYIWYLAYGSNILEERFLNYIRGGCYSLGGKQLMGCSDNTLPLDSRQFKIKNKVYFANKSSSWGNGGVAFLDPKPSDQEYFCRIWKIKYCQFTEIHEQEGNSKNWYDYILDLGTLEGIKIKTITNSNVLRINKTSINYIKTIGLGLKETFKMDLDNIIEYFLGLFGIKEYYTKNDLIGLF